ncbi:reverse transcriptase domain-containing protein [Tanacetum coccineum]
MVINSPCLIYKKELAIPGQTTTGKEFLNPLMAGHACIFMLIKHRIPPPPTIVPPSSMLSPMFNHQEFFLPKELLPLKKQGHDRSSSSTSALPQAFEIGESSRKTSLERHEEQIEEILNHLDELSLGRIKHIEDKIEGLRNGRVIIQQDFDNLEAKLRESHTQIAKLQRKQMGNNNKIALARFKIANLKQIIEEIQKLVADSVSATLEAQAANMANTDNTIRPREAPVARKLFSRSNSTEDYKVKFVTGTLTEEALSWWNSFAQPIGIEEAYKITWVEFKKLLIKKYRPRTEELATFCPIMVLDSEKMMEVFIGGLPQSIEGNVTTSKPQTLEEAINISQRPMDQVGHLTKNCRNKGPATGSNLLPVTVTCHACGERGHYANQCRKTTNNNAQGRAYMLRDRNAHQDPSVVMVMEKKSDEKRLEDILVVREFPKVFPEDLPGLPPVRQVEFQIDLIPGTTPVAEHPID